MQYTHRIVRLSIPYIKDMMNSKEDFEALAFCMLVKLCFKSSTLKNANYRRLKEVTHLGFGKLKSIINYCIERNMITRTGDTLVFNKLNQEGRYLYKFKNIYIKRSRKTLQTCNLTLTKVKDMLRKAIIANHIKKIENIREQALLTINPKNLAEYKKGKSIVRRLSVWGLNFFISNNRLATIANCSVSKLRTMKKKMLEYGEIESNVCNTLIKEQGTIAELYALRESLGEYHFLFLDSKHNIVLHNANTYCYKGKNIMRVPKNNK